MTQSQFDTLYKQIGDKIKEAQATRNPISLSFEEAEALHDALYEMNRHLPNFFEDEDEDQEMSIEELQALENETE